MNQDYLSSVEQFYWFMVLLPYSKNNISSFHSGFNLIDLTLNKNCNEDPKDFSLYPIINSIQKDSNTMVVDVSIVDNCCYYNGWYRINI